MAAKWIEEKIYGKGSEFARTAFSAIKNARKTAERIEKAFRKSAEQNTGFSGLLDGLRKAFRQAVNDAKRTARTEGTRVRNKARYDAGKQFEQETGQKAMKQWVCTFQNSRDSHIALHGVTIPLDEDFQAFGGPMKYPGDNSRVGPEEICNCKCYLIVGK